MTFEELEQAAAARGLVLVPQDIYEGMADQVLEAEELRCDLDRLVTLTVEDGLAGFLS